MTLIVAKRKFATLLICTHYQRNYTLNASKFMRLMLFNILKASLTIIMLITLLCAVRARSFAYIRAFLFPYEISSVSSINLSPNVIVDGV